jgi:transcriptional regulator with XRE-family HTH domain
MTEHKLFEARKIIAGLIRNRRIELKMSQEELAEKTNLGITTIKRFEAGKFWMNLKTLIEISEALKLKLEFKKI